MAACCLPRLRPREPAAARYYDPGELTPRIGSPEEALVFRGKGSEYGLQPVAAKNGIEPARRTPSCCAGGARGPGV
jgi:hypothetical protein